MVDFWINVILTIAVTFTLLLVDWIAGQVLQSRKRMTTIQRRVDELVVTRASKAEIQQEVKKLTTQRESLIWGSDLASIAFSLDLAILGIWISDSTKFPFFSSWNTANIKYEIPVWLIVLFIHFALLLFSIFLKHFHTERKEALSLDEIAKFPRIAWFSQNGYMLGSTLVGFLSLFSAFSVISNSLPIP